MGQVLEFNSQIIIPAGSGVDVINGALQNFQEVILGIGSFTFGASDRIIVPTGKVLRGVSTAVPVQPGTTLTSSATTGSFITLQGNCSLKNMTLIGPGSGVGSAHGVTTDGTGRVHTEKVRVTGFGGNGFDNMSGSMFRCDAIDNGGIGCEYVKITDSISIIWGCIFGSNLSDGLVVGGTANISGVSILDTVTNSNAGRGIAFGNAAFNTTNCFLYGITSIGNTVSHGIELRGANIDRVTIENCHLDSNSSSGISVRSQTAGSGILLNGIFASSNGADGISISTNGVTTMTHMEIIGCTCNSNTSDGIGCNPSDVDQIRITGCTTRANGATGITASGTTAGANNNGHVWGNRSEGNTGAAFTINASYVAADNV